MKSEREIREMRLAIKDVIIQGTELGLEMNGAKHRLDILNWILD